MILSFCSSPEPKDSDDSKPTVDTISEIVQEHLHSDSIAFDNGHKWVVEPEMMKIIKDMESDVHTFKGSELKEYLSLSGHLKSEIQTLTENCTMTGQAHDELHKWLLPYIDLVDSFSMSNSKKDAELKFEEIKKSFLLLNKYFE